MILRLGWIEIRLKRHYVLFRLCIDWRSAAKTATRFHAQWAHCGSYRRAA